MMSILRAIVVDATRLASAGSLFQNIENMNAQHTRLISTASPSLQPHPQSTSNPRQSRRNGEAHFSYARILSGPDRRSCPAALTNFTRPGMFEAFTTSMPCLAALYLWCIYISTNRGLRPRSVAEQFIAPASTASSPIMRVDLATARTLKVLTQRVHTWTRQTKTAANYWATAHCLVAAQPVLHIQSLRHIAQESRMSEVDRVACVNAHRGNALENLKSAFCHMLGTQDLHLLRSFVFKINKMMRGTWPRSSTSSTSKPSPNASVIFPFSSALLLTSDTPALTAE